MFYINRLIVTGNKLDNAELNFSNGLNYITGPSDRGKTFAFQCIKFMLGGTSRPKEIPEATPYTSVYLEINTNNRLYTLHRNINGGKLTVFYNNFDQIDISRSKDLLVSSKNSQTISDFYIDLINYSPTALLRSDASNSKRKIYYTNLRGYFIVSEIETISDKSPFLSDLKTDDTYLKALFKYVLTNEDDSKLITVDTSKLFDAKKSAKIEILRELISDLESSQQQIKQRLQGIDTSELDLTYALVSDDIDGLNNSIRELRNSRAESSNNIFRIQTQITDIQIALSKFERLKTIYNSDIKRYNFIVESAHYFYQLDEEICAHCGQDIRDGHEHGENLLRESISAAADRELQKTEESIKELDTTIKELSASLDTLRQEIAIQQNLRLDIDSQILSRTNIKKETSNQLQQIILYKQAQLSFEQNAKQMTSYTRQILAIDLAKPDKPKNSYDIRGESLTFFENRLKRILICWGLEINDVLFNVSDMDFTFNSRKRKTSGKGYASIYRMAIVLAFAKTAKRFKRPYTNFIVIDTPFTPFKEEVSDDEVYGRIHRRAFNHLARSYNDMQIVIFENKSIDLPQQIASNINLIEFDNSRGFIPNRV